jgi:hypothetical protein
VAVTVVGPLTVKVHAPVPEQPAPLHPVKTDPADDVAVRVTEVPLEKPAEHVDPQLMPDGLLVTVPVPVPLVVLTATVYVGIAVNVAVTDLAASIVTEQFPVPGHEIPLPLQPEKVKPAPGVATSTTVVPLGKSKAQVAPQAIPDGVLVTVPVPVLETVSVNFGIGLKVAVTSLSASIVRAQLVDVPAHALPQPPNVYPLAGVAVRITLVPLEKLAEHTDPQLMEVLGELVTVPLPL